MPRRSRVPVPQTISVEQFGPFPVLMTGPNASGEVIDKMIDAQSIIVASAATRWYGGGSKILRYVIFRPIVFACFVGVLTMPQAHVPPFTAIVH